MPGVGEAVEVVLRLQGERAFIAGTRASAESMRELGAASARAGEESRASSVKMGRSGVLMDAAKKGAVGLGVALAGTAIEAAKMGIEFQKQMELVHTQAGASQGEVRKLSGEVLNLAKVTPQGPQELAKGLYHLESLGLRGAKAMHGLRIAAMGAAIGNADLEQAATAMGAAWRSGIPGAQNLTKVMAVMNATVGAGNMRMDDLTTALGTGILPAAKNAGLGLKDVMGALATLTDEGWQGSSAMAQLATALHYVTNPGSKAAGALAQVHLSQTQLARDMRDPRKGLIGTLRDLQAHLRQFGGNKINQQQIMGDILPGGRGRVLAVLMNNINVEQQKYNQIGRTSAGFWDNWHKTQQTNAFKLHTAWSGLQVALIKLGSILMGPATSALTAVMHAGSKLIGVFANLVSGSHHVNSGVGKDFRSLGQTFKAVAHVIAWVAGPVWKGLEFSFSHGIHAIAQWFGGMWKAIKGVANIIAGIFTLDFGRAWDGLKQLFSGGVQGLVGFWKAMINPIRATAVIIWEGLKKGLAAVVNWIIDQLNTIIGGFNSTAGQLLGQIGLIQHVSTAASNAVVGAGALAVGHGASGGGGASASITAHGGHVARRAVGGSVRRGEITLVGEHGRPEVARFPSGTVIEPIRDSTFATPTQQPVVIERHHHLTTQLVVGRRVLAQVVDTAIEHERASI